MRALSLSLIFLSIVLAGHLARADGPAAPTLAIGSQAPDFALPGVDGKVHKLAEYSKAKALVIIFTCNHCPTAQGYEERIKKLAADYKRKNVALVAISPNDPAAVRPDELGYTDLSDSLEDMKIRAQDHRFNFPYLFGGGEFEPVSRAYGPVATPHAFLFDAARKLRYAGRIDDNEREAYVKVQDLRLAIDALIADKPVPPAASSRVFGCSTKWSSKRDGVKQFFEKLAAEPVTIEPADAATLSALRANKAPAGEGKVRLINVWATWCGPCATEFPDLVTMNTMYRQRDFEFVTVAAQFPDEQPEVLKFLKKHKASARNLIFSGTDKYKLIEALDPKWEGALPYTLLLDTDGKVLYRQQGPIDALALRRLIVRALNQKRPWKG